MIQFQREDPGLERIEEIIRAKKQVGVLVDAQGRAVELPDTLYVFGANRERAASIYLSPNIPNVQQISMFLNGKGMVAAAEAVGDPPWNQWVAFHRRIRDNSPQLCARVCMFLEFCINNQVVW